MRKPDLGAPNVIGIMPSMAEDKNINGFVANIGVSPIRGESSPVGRVIRRPERRTVRPH